MAIKPIRFAALGAAILTLSSAMATFADTLDWLPDDPAKRWSPQLRLNLELDVDLESPQNEQSPTKYAEPLDWVFWGPIRAGENVSRRSKREVQYIHEIAICSGQDQPSSDDGILLTATPSTDEDTAVLDRIDDGEPWDAEDDQVVALTDLPVGSYRVSVVLNKPPEAFHISAETEDGVKIHDFIRDRESRIQLVTDGNEGAIAWRYSFAAKVDDSRRVRICIRRAAPGFVAFDTSSGLGPMGLVIEQDGTDGSPLCDCPNGAANVDPLVIVMNSQSAPITQFATPFVFTAPTQEASNSSSGSGVSTQSFAPFSPTGSPITLGAPVGGGGGGTLNTTGTPTSTAGGGTTPTTVPEPSATCFCLVAASLFAASRIRRSSEGNGDRDDEPSAPRHGR